MDNLVAEFARLEKLATKGKLNNRLQTARIASESGRLICECKSGHNSERDADAQLYVLFRNNLLDIIDALGTPKPVTFSYDPKKSEMNTKKSVESVAPLRS